jgi:hypothetical protein
MSTPNIPDKAYAEFKLNPRIHAILFISKTREEAKEYQARLKAQGHLHGSIKDPNNENRFCFYIPKRTIFAQGLKTVEEFIKHFELEPRPKQKTKPRVAKN